MSSPKPRPGLTLVELLVVVSLLGLMASIVTVRLTGSTDGARLRAATIQIEQVLRRARSEATLKHRPVVLSFEPGTSRYRLEDHGRQTDWKSLDGVTIVSASFREPDGASGGSRLFSVRMGPSGASLPWALELHCRDRRRVVWSDGVTGRLRMVDAIGIQEFDWKPYRTPADSGTLP